MRRAVAGCFAWALLAGLSQAATAQQPPAPDRWQPARDAAQRLITERGVAGVAVAVAKDGKIIWEEGFGWANREKMLPVIPNTMFSLASISKPFTAAGLTTLGRRQMGLTRCERPKGRISSRDQPLCFVRRDRFTSRRRPPRPAPS